MTINDFENHISSTIVSRGKDYFSRKNISTLKEVKRGEWTAEVEGTDTYEVEVLLEGEKIEDWSCDCPYDGGDVCKHVVAVLFGIRAKLKIQPVYLPTTTAKNASANSFNDILGKIAIDELRFFVRELTNKDKALENSFLLYFAHYNTQSTTKQYYADILKANFKIRKGRNRSISYSDIEEVMQPVYDLEESFESMMDQELYENVFNIIQAIYEELITYIVNLEEPYDDYEDEYDEEHMYTAVSNAVDYLKQIQVSENAPVVLKNEIFNYVLHALKISLYKDNTEVKMLYIRRLSTESMMMKKKSAY